MIVWVSIFAFCINVNSFLNLIVFSEITWVSLYTYALIVGAQNDDITMLSTSFLILGLASLEFSTGLLLIILYKNFFQSTNLLDVEAGWKQYYVNTNSRVYVYKYTWTNLKKN